MSYVLAKIKICAETCGGLTSWGCSHQLVEKLAGTGKKSLHSADGLINRFVFKYQLEFDFF